MITTTNPQAVSSSDSESSTSGNVSKIFTIVVLFILFLVGAALIRYLSLGFYKVNFGLLRKFVEARRSLLA